jgi:CheY-like chemotaxis protein
MRFTILLVEDNVTFRRILKKGLDEFFPSMIISEAGDGEEALRKIETLLPSLIFMDADLPGRTAISVVAAGHS